MLRKLAIAGVLLLALSPSVYLAWTLRTMPHLGYYHDDGIYWVSAKSLAEGHGYRIPSLPGEPYQTKYPPVYSALLAGLWKLNPNFPANVPLATLFAWMSFPVFLAMLWLFLRQHGFSLGEQLGLLILAAVSPIAVVFSFSLMPELLFTALLLASILLAERSFAPESPGWLPILAGVCAALAYLTKSIALPLLITVPLCFALRRRFTSAMLFVAAMLPAPVGWLWWVSQHISNARDLVTLYYTNYLGFQILNVPLRDLPLVVWNNLGNFLMGTGKLLMFDMPHGNMYLECVVAVGAIAGCVRLARRTGMLQYPMAALGISALLLIWHFTPDQRFVFPLYPLLLAGIWTELKNIAGTLRLAWNKATIPDRAAALAGAGLIAAFASFVLFTTAFGLSRFLPGVFTAYQTDLESRLPAYRWIAKNVPSDARFYAYDDPLLFLYTGRKSCSLPVPTKLYYHNDQAGIDRLLDSIPHFARQYDLSYALVTPGDFYRDLHAHGALRLINALESAHAGHPYGTSGVSVYAFPHDPITAQARVRAGL